MPTGYTADISKGITFEEYAWNCARAFGALVEMRDQPIGATIPEQFEVDNFYLEQIEEVKKKIKWLEKLASDVKACDRQAKTEYKKELQLYEKRKVEIDDLKEKYNAMLERVRVFNPPSNDHVPLKEFMEEQIIQTMEHDCDHKYNTPPTLLTGKQWLAREVKRAETNFKYYLKEYEKQVKYVDDRNRWVNQLRETIGPQPQSKKKK